MRAIPADSPSRHAFALGELRRSREKLEVASVYDDTAFVAPPLELEWFDEADEETLTRLAFEKRVGFDPIEEN